MYQSCLGQFPLQCLLKSQDRDSIIPLHNMLYKLKPNLFPPERSLTLSGSVTWVVETLLRAGSLLLVCWSPLLFLLPISPTWEIRVRIKDYGPTFRNWIICFSLCISELKCYVFKLYVSTSGNEDSLPSSFTSHYLYQPYYFTLYMFVPVYTYNSLVLSLFRFKFIQSSPLPLFRGVSSFLNS